MSLKICISNMCVHTMIKPTEMNGRHGVFRCDCYNLLIRNAYDDDVDLDDAE
jgi:hypothetical protein